MAKTWFITGCSRGFGRHWAQAALARGDSVAATARDTASLDELVEAHGERVLALRLDVRDREAAFACVDLAHSHFGRLDVVVNNAGYGLFGAIEEISEELAREQLDTNLLGALWVTQAALPLLRAQGSGHIVQVSSIGGIVAFPLTGLYHASKWGLEGFSEALAQEVAQFGIRVTLVEPGGFDTDWAGSSAVHAPPIEAYEPLREARRAGSPVGSRGHAEATSAAILELVDNPEPPLRLLLGRAPLGLARERYAQRLASWEEWSEVALAAHGSD
ncbi:MAG TPA: SDR family oxidoreductase [Solirubrobacteraceae bacterium]|nr:SDR family oxidoreductase [Solirubrobacteraceae bacterium]